MIRAKIWQGMQWRIIEIVDGSNTCRAANGKFFPIDADGNVDTGTYRFRIYHIDATEYNGGNHKPQLEAK